MGEWKDHNKGKKKKKKRVQQQQEEGAGEPGLVFCRMLGEEVGARGRRLGWPAGDKLGGQVGSRRMFGCAG